MTQQGIHHGSPTNLYLSEATRVEGTRLAKERYHMSFSEYIGAIVDREARLKKGLLKLRKTATGRHSNAG